jgi:NADPH:quinone reductase-like Zn-dependent oxidoreductase
MTSLDEALVARTPLSESVGQSRTKTMKAAVCREFGKPLTIEQVPVPEVGPGQILVKIAACGVCHTDLHAISGDWPVKPNPPFIPGHEGVGHVVEVGQGVTGVKQGDASAFPGSTRPADTAATASALGRPCVRASRTPAIP